MLLIADRRSSGELRRHAGQRRHEERHERDAPAARRTTFRNENMSGGRTFRSTSTSRSSSTASQLGGPIIKDKLHFFIAPEWQSRSQPAIGPYEGGPTTEAGNISPDTLQRIANAINSLFPIGGTGLVSTGNPLTNLSGRLDWQVNSGNRVVFRQLYNTAEQDNFSRNNRNFNASVGNQNSGFRYTSNMYTTQDDNIRASFRCSASSRRGRRTSSSWATTTSRTSGSSRWRRRRSACR